MTAQFVPVGDQIPIVEGDSSALVLAGPGRGKTVTALAAAARWLNSKPNGRALFTSFSNAAVRRLASASGIPPGRRLEFRTFHSVALEVLKQYGRFAGLAAPARALDKMEERLVIAENGWSGDHKEQLAEYARRTGRVPFSLMVPWATSLLAKSGTLRHAVSGRFPLIVVDEFQDTTEEQWAFLQMLGAGSRVLALGDEHQMIYGRQFQAALTRFEEFETWKTIKRTRLALDSFRCRVPEILAFGEALLEGKRLATKGDALAFWPVYRNQTRAQLAAIWAAVRRHSEDRASIAFLVPSADRAERLAEDLREPDKGKAIPIPIRAKMERSEDRMDAFRLAVYAGMDHAANPNEQSIHRLAFALETLVSLASRRSLQAEEVVKLLVKSRAASPLRDFFTASPATSDAPAFAEGFLHALEADKRFDVPAQSIRRQGVPSIQVHAPLNGSMFDGYRAQRMPRLEGIVPSTAKTSIVSMHRCKGREFDYVVMVVDPRAHRVDADIGELRRLHYVAATRAKRWLGVVYVRNDVGNVLQPVLQGSAA